MRFHYHYKHSESDQVLKPLSANHTQNGQTHSKRFVDDLTTNCLSVFDRFVGLALKGLIIYIIFSERVLLHCW